MYLMDMYETEALLLLCDYKKHFVNYADIALLAMPSILSHNKKGSEAKLSLIECCMVVTDQICHMCLFLRCLCVFN